MPQTAANPAIHAPLPLCGLLVVNKPLGWSSMDVVRRVRRAAGGAKTGHAGTLDPLATGVVICCIGKATSLVESLMGLTKVYHTQIDLTAFTTTDDREGPREEIVVQEIPSLEKLRTVLDSMIGLIPQKPPVYSAIHIDGQRAYKLARKGKVVDIPARIIRIDSIEILSYHWPVAELKITCGRGTYIRSIARELGEKLGTGGHLASLKRLSVGPYDLFAAADEARLKLPIRQNDLIQMP